MQYIGTHNMKQKLENHEMEKFKALNEDLLDDEDHPELIDLCNKILKDLEETTEHYKKIAKKKGIKYNITKKGTKKPPNQDSKSSLNPSQSHQSQRANSILEETENQPTLTMGGDAGNATRDDRGSGHQSDANTSEEQQVNS